MEAITKGAREQVQKCQNEIGLENVFSLFSCVHQIPHIAESQQNYIFHSRLKTNIYGGGSTSYFVQLGPQNIDYNTL